jgi:dihydropteroate synthase-like protein
MSIEPAPHIHFVTGRLAQHALRRMVAELSQDVGFDYSIDVLPITVAALMTPDWIAGRWNVPAHATRVVLPGYCSGDTAPLVSAAPCPVELGPRDLHQLPRFFARPPLAREYGGYNIEILAEINHCPRVTLPEILAEAARLAGDGADLIDVGCEPHAAWEGVADAVRALREAGHRVSIDSLNPVEIAAAVAAGAELVLSVNSHNREAARDWGVEVVVTPDTPGDAASIDDTVEYLAAAGVPLRIDPILEPIGFGFAASLQRYYETRQRYPEAPMLMGIGNLTELTDVDSAGVNTLLLAICQEWDVRSVLTTQVINWARRSVRECDVARRLVFHAIENRVLPKHLTTDLVMLRDEELLETPLAEIETLQETITDSNYRIFASDGEIHLIAAGMHLHNADPFILMDQLQQAGPGGGPPRNLSPAHTFYLGYEMAKAATALTLGKTYRQDEPLHWGFDTRPESHRRLRRGRPPAPDQRRPE